MSFPGLSSFGPSRNGTGASPSSYGRAANPAAAGDGRGPALAGEGRAISGNAVQSIQPHPAVPYILLQDSISKAKDLLYISPQTLAIMGCLLLLMIF